MRGKGLGASIARSGCRPFRARAFPRRNPGLRCAAAWAIDFRAFGAGNGSRILPDKNAKVVLDAAGGVYAVWQRGGDLVMDRNFLGAPAAVWADSTTLGFADFALTLGPGGKVLALWQEMSAAGSDAHYRVFDPASNTWGLDTLPSNDAALERSFAPV